MGLSVDLQMHGGVSAQLANLVGRTAPALPPGSVAPVAADPISQAAAARLSSQSTAVVNSYIDGLNQIHLAAHHIGAAMVDYADTEDGNTQLLGGSAGPAAANPVPVSITLPHLATSESAATQSASDYDPMTFATWMQSGSEQGPADYGNSVQSFLAGSYADTANTVSQAQGTLESWQPHGERLAGSFGNFQDWHSQLGDSFGQLTSRAQSYGAAYRSAASQHPTPAQLTETRQQLLAANASGDSAAVAAAYNKMQQQYALSQQVIQQYRTAAEAAVPESGAPLASPPTLAHEGWWQDHANTAGAGTAASTTDTAGSGSSGSTGSTSSGDSTSGSSTSSGSTSSGTDSSSSSSDSSASSSSDSSDSSTDMEMLMSMAPGMMQMATQGANMLTQHDHAASVPAATPVSSVNPMAQPMPVGSLGDGGDDGSDLLGDPSMTEQPIEAAAAAPEMPRTSVIGGETSAAPATTPTAVGAGGAPYAPYMPPMGSNRAGGKDRDRVVAWNPDRPMYVDNTPYTQMVIGEAPTVAPTVTPSTPADSAPAQTGGAA